MQGLRKAGEDLRIPRFSFGLQKWRSPPTPQTLAAGEGGGTKYENIYQRNFSRANCT